MAPRFKTNMYQVYAGDERANGLICFSCTKPDPVFLFRDALANKISADRDLVACKDQGHPTPLDSWFGFFKEEDAQAAESFFERDCPGVLARLWRSRKWKDFEAEKKRIMSLVELELNTSHDYPCIDVYTRMYSTEELSKTIEHVAGDLNIDMPRNLQLPPIDRVLFTNRSFDL